MSGSQNGVNGSQKGWSPTGRVLGDVMVWMCLMGILVGLVFPPFAVLMGVEPSTAFRPVFFAACIAAGIAVGVTGGLIVRRVVGSRLAGMATKMAQVRGRLMEAADTGERQACSPEDCYVELDSADELGRCAASFNALVSALSESHDLEARANDLSRALARHLELDDLAREALARLVVSGPFDGAAICLLRRDEIEMLDCVGLLSSEGLVDNDLIRRAIEHDESRTVEVPDGIEVDGALVGFRPRTVLVRPLTVNSVPFGAIVLASAGPVPATDLRLLDAGVSGLSLALRNGLAHAELERLAAIDGLTGAFNRRFGRERLNDEFARANRSTTSLGIVMLDLDHFKVVNDTYGHLVGDKVLRSVTAAASQVLREGDVLVRFGGEEFLLILPGASSGDAREIAERIRRRCADLTTHVNDAEVRITVSMGIAAWPECDAGRPDALVEAADQALYAAKRGGRDAVVSWGSHLTLTAPSS